MTSPHAPTTVRVPATIANMGPGFDSFGMAVSLYNEFTFSPTERDALLLPPTEKQAELLAMVSEIQVEPGKHLLWRAFESVYKTCGQNRPAVSIAVKSTIPLARGLGSSSTAIVAALLTANRWLGEPLSRDTLLELAIELEHHPDNVAPALLGGVVLYDTAPYSLPWPANWQILALSPAYSVSTKQARGILAEQVPMTDAVFNLRKASLLTYALLQEDPDALRQALEDRLHQPVRSGLIPEYEALRTCALANGAYGFIVSGSGPTMACFYPAALEQSLSRALQNRIQDLGGAITLYELSIDRSGAVIL
jgi:homoserine kinase